MLSVAAESVGGRRLVLRGEGAEQELVSQAIMGEPRAWEALVQHLTPTIHNQVAMVLLAKRGSRRVVVQDVLDFRQDWALGARSGRNVSKRGCL